MTTSDKVMEHIHDTRDDKFLQFLSNYWEVEIGYITSFNQDGTCKVMSFRFMGGNQVEWDKVELIYIGTVAGSIRTDLSGSTVLLFRPRTPIYASTREIDLGGGDFSRSGIKALPISSGTDDVISHGVDNKGSWYFNSADYKMEYTREGIMLWYNNSLLFNMTSQGTLSFNTNNYVYQYLTDGTIQEIWKDKDGKISLAIVYATDGTITTLRYSEDKVGSDKLLNYDKWKWKEVLSPDGSRTLSQPDNSLDVSIDSSGNISIASDNATVKIGNGGDIKLDANGTSVTLANGGNFTIEGNNSKISSSATGVSINGHLEIST